MADDTTYVEGPDTPAPLFAFRAFRSILYNPQPAKPTAKSLVKPKPAPKSPAKPSGILLTPGTAGRRRKSVTFGDDVVDKVPTPWKEDDDTPRVRPGTKLTAALEDSRKKPTTPEPTIEDDPAWEEVDDIEGDPDATIDLNEPHSQSGKYWKTEHKKYRDEAKMEMDKLVRYKQLAKSYAKIKDDESLQLREKVATMEEKMAAMEEKMGALETENKELRTKLGAVNEGRQPLERGPDRMENRKLKTKPEVITKEVQLEVGVPDQVENGRIKAKLEPANKTKPSAEVAPVLTENKRAQAKPDEVNKEGQPRTAIPDRGQSKRSTTKLEKAKKGNQSEEVAPDHMENTRLRAKIQAVSGLREPAERVSDRPPGRAAAAIERLARKRAERAREMERMREAGVF